MGPTIAVLAIFVAIGLIQSAGGFTRRQAALVSVAVLAAILAGSAIGYHQRAQPPSSGGPCWGCTTPTQQP